MYIAVFFHLGSLLDRAALDIIKSSGALGTRGGRHHLAPVIIQVPLEVPAEILEGLSNGVYNLFGGVVRDASGAIVKLLRDAPNPPVKHLAATAKQAAGRAPGVLRNPWVIGATLLGTVVVATVLASAVHARRDRASEPVISQSVELPASLTTYNNALGAYLDAARAGALEEAVINQLISAVDEVVHAAQEGIVVLDVSAPESVQLASLVVAYTRSLAVANSIDLGALLANEEPGDGDALGDLRRYLRVQRRIFTQNR